MTIISCIKQVHDLDIVLKDDWLIKADGLSIDIDYANRIMNTFDETSLELMLRLSDGYKMKTKVITIGPSKSDSILRKALAVGVDEAVRLETSEDLTFRPDRVALYLKKYLLEVISSNDDVEIIMCGRQADNGSHGQTGQLLAAMLGWPCLTMVIDISKEDDCYKVSRLTDSGIEHIYVSTPVVLTITQSNDKLLRMATLKATIDAKKKAIEVYPLNQEKMDSSIESKLMHLSIDNRKKKCIYLEEKINNSIVDQMKQVFIDEGIMI